MLVIYFDTFFAHFLRIINNMISFVESDPEKMHSKIIIIIYNYIIIIVNYKYIMMKKFQKNVDFSL